MPIEMRLMTAARMLPESAGNCVHYCSWKMASIPPDATVDVAACVYRWDRMSVRVASSLPAGAPFAGGDPVFDGPVILGIRRGGAEELGFIALAAGARGAS